ncbi:ABC transporter substrate-binding protein [Kordiimonas lipolytica]|uniref:ABC transporter substrate-binding protein n=1 Tax=Kordiimonas lipolytica TaxID=1662421 RepID=A0ABV8UE95_9PROT|nr:ABC transporter substrate-binding protein [Kordiimonas lipolytica]
MELGSLRTAFIASVLVCGLSLAGAGAADVPDYYPADYEAMVEASRSEGSLLIYSNIAEYNWRDIFVGFSKKYPWIKIESIDLGPSTSFERYYSESSVGKRTADLIVTGAPDGWYRFAAKGGLAQYSSPEVEKMPEWSRPLPGLYTISADPMVIIHNKLLLKDAPDSLADIRELTEEGGRYRDKVTTYNATSHSFAYDIHWSVTKAFGDAAWPLFDDLGSLTRSESGGAVMVEKVTSGEYVAGYFVSGITVFQRMNQAGRDKIMGWSLIEDGTPVFHRGMGVTTGAESPNSARLMLDYILSHDGQVAVGKGGLTPYRPDVGKDEVPYLSYGGIVDEIGEENIIHVEYDPEAYEQRDVFLARWKQAFRIKN